MTRELQTTARLEARRASENTAIFRLSAEDQRQLAEALLNPPDPSDGLEKAFRRRRELFGVE